jgi:hypothetical protein
VYAQHTLHAQSLHASHLLPGHVCSLIPESSKTSTWLKSRSFRSNLKQHRLVKICAGYTFCGWLATVLVLFLNCHPLSGYWTLPPPQEECASYFRYEVTQAVFNISSDLAILGIILPMLFQMKMPWKTKLPLVFIFSMGLVVVCFPCPRPQS